MPIQHYSDPADEQFKNCKCPLNTLSPASVGCGVRLHAAAAAFTGDRFAQTGFAGAGSRIAISSISSSDGISSGSVRGEAAARFVGDGCRRRGKPPKTFR